MTHVNQDDDVNKTNCPEYPGLHDNPWLCDCQISMVMSLSMSVGSPVVLMDQLLICSRALGQSGVLQTQAELSRCMRPSVQPAATRVISPLGSNVILRCDATGYPTPTLTWIKTSAYAGKQSRLPLCWQSHIHIGTSVELWCYKWALSNRITSHPGHSRFTTLPSGTHRTTGTVKQTQKQLPLQSCC